MKIEEIADEKLLELCAYWGSQALNARYKFIGLLPEVNRRRLYEKKGFSSIFEYAYKTAGLSEKQVRTALRLRERVENKPALKQLLESGEVSFNKIEKVSYVATPGTDELWANRVQTNSTKALVVMVRDEKSLDVQTFGQQQIEVIDEPRLSDEVKRKLNELARKKIDINEIILNALTAREQEIALGKNQEAEKSRTKVILAEVEGRKVKRSAVSVITKRLLTKEYGKKCAIEFCNKDSEEIHHTARFSMSKSHNPHYLAPLCKAHHEIAHSVDVHANMMRKKSITSFVSITQQKLSILTK